MSSGNPSVYEFNPRIIPYQHRVLRAIRKEYDYSLGTHEIMLSGTVGSAKSLLMAHCGITHCLDNPGAILGLGRKAMPDLKDTIFQTILDHMEGDLVEGVDYYVNRTRAQIFFANGSKIISRSWSDKKYKKWRSISLSAALVEELTENDDQDKEAIDELRMRVGRVPGIRENWILYATNPDSPAHWAYKEFIKNPTSTRKVFYSLTSENPFLPPQYIKKLEENMDPLMARRMLRGEWLEIKEEVIYHQYKREVNFRNESYEVNKTQPIHMSFDFNIGEGKPMSAVFFQYIGDTFHFFNEIIVHGSRTEDIVLEAASRGLLNSRSEYVINGDATGKSRDTRGKMSDYDIIKRFLSNHMIDNDGNYINFRFCVPNSNPPVRTRHNTVNAQLCNSLGKRRLFIYKDCPILDEGMSLTRLKKGGQYIEDDSKHYQHCTTALGYGVISRLNENNAEDSVMMVNR